MNEVLAVDQVAAPPSAGQPSVLELEDLLYDIVASGADPSLPPGTFEAVQTFLHEHARSRHSLPEFLAFFATHGLSTVKETTLTFALPPPIELRAPVAPAPAPVTTPAVRDPDPIEVVPIQAEPRRTGTKTIAIVSAVAVAALSCGAWLGVAASRSELDRVRAEQRATAELLARVQAESATLRQTVERNAALVQRVDQKSELLLQTLVSPLDPAQR